MIEYIDDGKRALFNGLVFVRDDQTGYLERIHVQEAARIAGAPRFAKVKAIRRRPPEPVYNMEVEHFHNFAVNGGLIVHNCLDSSRYSLEPEIGRRVATTRKDVY